MVGTLHPQHRCIPLWVRAILFLLLSIPFVANSQYLRKDWDFDYGGDRWEECNSFIETSAGNYIMAGYTGSDASGDITETTNDLFPSPDKGDFWLIMTDANGVNLDNRRYGGDREDRLWSIQETFDGGYIMGGWSRSNVSGDKSEPSFGGFDFWVIKIDQNLDYSWDRTYGGNADDVLFELIQTSDGGFLAVGTSNSDVSGTKTKPHLGQNDLWIVKMDSNGDFKWENTIGGTEEERVNAVFEEPDGNYVIAGACESPVDGLDILEPRIGGKDFWVIKVDSLDGSKYWEKRYGGIDEDEIQSMVPVSTGGYLMVGGSRSPMLAGMKSENSQMVDIWAVKVDQTGDVIEWERTLGGAQFDNSYSVKENSVGNFILGGYSQSDLSATKQSPNRGPVGTSDYWINYLAPDGTQVWDQAFGGPESDVLEDIFQTSDGGYVLAGHSRTDIGGDKTDPTEGLNDFWIIKTLCDVSVDFQDTVICPNTDFVLDARDPNCVLCDWNWENSTKDSLRTINIGSAQTYSVTLTDGVGCRWSDDVNVDVHVVAPVDLGPDGELCQGDSVEIGVQAQPSFSYIWSTAEPTPTISIDSTGTYTLSVTDTNGCIVEDSLALLVRPIPVVDIGPDTALCAGSDLTISAGAGFTNYSWSPLGNTESITITPTGPIIIQVTVENQYQCAGSDEIFITDVFPVPMVNNILTDCDDNNSGYTLSFELSNNAPSDITLNGISGTWVGNIFTSDVIPTGMPYDFFVENMNSCSSPIETGNGNCICLSNAGQIDDTAVNICGDGTHEVTLSNFFLDVNDNIELILHDGNANLIGSILHSYPTNEIFNPGNIILGQTYFLAVRVGNGEGTTVNLNDGCLSVSDGIPVVFYDSPTAVVSLLGPQYLDCNVTDLPLDGTFSVGTGNLNFSWFTQNGNIVGATNIPQVTVDEPGWYTLIIGDAAGCVGIDSIFVDQDEDVPEIVLSDPEILTCNQESTMISSAGSSEGMDFEMYWTGPNIDGLNTAQVEITQAGSYSLIIENVTTGCDDEMFFTVAENMAGPDIDAGLGPEISCATNQATLSGNFVSACDGCPVVWTSIQGNVVQGFSQLEPTIEGIGWYYLTAQNLSNGCENIDSVLVEENTNVPNDLDLIATGPPCIEDEYGLLTVGQVSGGTAPYQYSLDGLIFQNDNEFELLLPGTYNLIVSDNLECTAIETFDIPFAEAIDVQLQNDLTINLGESINLNPVMTSNVFDLIWTGTGTENCPDCPSQIVVPLERTEYIITVWDENGCEATDRILVEVKDDVSVYIPNIFSPNNDGNNDLFAPQFSGENVALVENFSIFNRWGAAVHQEKKVLTNQLEGWDGRFRNEFLNSNVFVFMLEFTLINGETRILSGDVTLIK